MLPDSPYNQTHWDDSRYQKLYAEANQTTDEARQKEISYEMQGIDFEQGGYIIYSFYKQVTLMNEKVGGLKRSGGGIDPAYRWDDIFVS